MNANAPVARLLSLACITALAACGAPPAGPDGSTDSAADAAVEAALPDTATPADASADGSAPSDAGPSMDGAVDGSTDGAADAGPSMDGAVDGSIDGSIDGSADARADARADSAVDGSPDGSLACSMYVGDAAWAARLLVEPGALLCAHVAREWFSTGMETEEQMKQRVMREAIARKSTISMPAGSLALPTATEMRGYLLPMCVTDNGAPGPVPTAATRVTVTRVEGGIGRANGTYVEGTFGLGAETLVTTVYRPLTSATTATLSASPAASHLGSVSAIRGARLYTSCNLAPNRCVNLTAPGLGAVRMDEYTWASSPGLGFAALVRVRGTINGAAVDVSRYESMTTVYGHHAFDRRHFVRFAAPAGGACGVLVDVNVSGTYALTPATCDGAPMGAPVTATAATTPCA